MITIAGQQADASLAHAYWIDGAMQRRIVELMLRNEFPFQYDSLAQFQFEVRMRREIIRYSRVLESGGMDFAPTYAKSRANPRYWSRTLEGGFRVRYPYTAAAAIRDIFTNGSQYEFECATAVFIVYYRALLAEIGDAKFNDWFPNLYLFNGEYDPKLHLVARDTLHFVPGDEVYFKNPDYDPNTPEWQGENAIDLGDGTYWGHGIGIVPASGIVASLNRHRRRGARHSAVLLDQATNPDYRKLSDAAAGLRQGKIRVGRHTYLF